MQPEDIFKVVSKHCIVEAGGIYTRFKKMVLLSLAVHSSVFSPCSIFEIFEIFEIFIRIRLL